jgi:hypothetical protein
MDNYKEETTEKTTVKFTVGKNGELEFKSDGLDPWQQTEAIGQARQLANGNSVRQIKITEIQATTAIASHIIMGSFLTLLVFGTTFSCSRLVSTQVNQPVQQVTK